MKHYIIVKFNEEIRERQRLEREIAALFQQATRIEGVSEVCLSPAILRSEKRYDLMICLRMRRDALEAFDRSDVHRLWKERFSEHIAHKVIFDCE